MLISISPDELLSPDIVATELHLRPQALMAWRTLGRGPNFVKVGRAVFYRRSDIAAWLGANHREPVKRQASETT